MYKHKYCPKVSLVNFLVISFGVGVSGYVPFFLPRGCHIKKKKKNSMIYEFNSSI